MLLAGAVGFTMDVMTVFTGGGASPYYGGTSLVMLAVVLLMPWSPKQLVSICVALLGMYILVTLATDPSHDLRPLVIHASLLAATGAIAIAAATLREQLRWREFCSRSTLVAVHRQQAEFFASMSHELRTPIHATIGYADILLEEALEAGGHEARRMIERIRTSNLLLHRLVSNLLDYAKVDAGKMEVHAEPVRIRDLVVDIGASFRPLAEKKGVGLQVVCPEDLPDVTTDRQKLQQVLNNLLANALKFTERGEVTIEAHTPAAVPPATLTQFLFLDGANGQGTPATQYAVALVVRDTGVGIRTADLPLLGMDFQQVGSGTSATLWGNRPRAQPLAEADGLARGTHRGSKPAR